MVNSTPSIVERRVERRRMSSMVSRSAAEPLERVVLALHRDEHLGGGGQRVEGQQAERRRAVDDDVVELFEDRVDRTS